MPGLLWFINDSISKVHEWYLVVLSTLLYNSVLVNLCDKVPLLKMFLWIYSVCDPFPSTALPLSIYLSLSLWLACTLVYHAWVKIREQEEDWEKEEDMRARWKREEENTESNKWRRESEKAYSCSLSVSGLAWPQNWVCTCGWRLGFLCRFEVYLSSLRWGWTCVRKNKTTQIISLFRCLSIRLCKILNVAFSSVLLLW